MKAFFPLPPWEHPGADFDPAPHAVTRRELGGKKRTLWLKMRDGVIFFREASRAPLFAVPRFFDPELARDAERLVWQWAREVEQGNYGAYFLSRRSWALTLACATYCIILRADGSGWIKENFDHEWREFALPFARPLNLWGSKPAYGGEASSIVAQVALPFLDRAVDARHFESVPPAWKPRGEADLMTAMRSAATLWMAPDGWRAYARGTIDWVCRSNSAQFAGGVVGPLTYTGEYRLDQVWEIAKWQCGFVGVEWKRADEHPELQARYGLRVWKSHRARWGDNWRGLWVGQPYRASLKLAALSPPSAHDKLEAALFLREFLREQMPEERLNAWIEEGLRG